ncbi:MAG TPA: HEAT repeat domain-containing protein [Bryobacteraceae bacterium]|jgi:HEAT repeat protein|nr:HEAT repeat domain-containing protein [Bryobacteraceae bacterium]
MKICFFVLASVSAIGLAAQAVDDGFPDLIPETHGNVTEMPTIERAIERAGYALTRDSLIAALRDSRAQVRSMAAEKLGREGAKGTIPEIREALSVEKAPGTRILMANALAVLGDDQGVSELQTMCKAATDPDWLHRANLRLVAAGSAVEFGKGACGGEVIDILNTLASRTSTAPERQANLIVYGLSIVVRDALAFKPDQEAIRELALRYLADGRAEVRMAASNCLGLVGDADSARALQKAIASEPDGMVRTRMLANLNLLQEAKY